MAAPPRLDPRDILLRSWPGRLFLIAAALKLVTAAFRGLGELPVALQVLGSAATIGLAVSVAYFLWKLFVLVKRRLLWRVRRKLILSYIFIGVVPALLIVAFFLVSGVLVFMNISTYLFRSGYDDVVETVRLAAEAAASEIGRAPATAPEILERSARTARRFNDGISFLYLPELPAGPPVVAGAWAHGPPPDDLPEWVRPAGFAGTIAAPRPDGPVEAELVIRAVVHADNGRRRTGTVIVDLPVDDAVLARLRETTGVRAGTITLGAAGQDVVTLSRSRTEGPEDGTASLFGHSVIFLDCRDWETGDVRRASIAGSYRVGELYRMLSRAQAVQVGTHTQTFGELVLVVLVAVAVLFLIIQLVALVMGFALARSITSSIHELFMGTERVQQGDFAHRIEIRTKDQLGELADSFNQMTRSIENLLQTAAEKKRLEEELRIARQIQMSLLPRGALDVPGLAITGLCVPAREVGGDYYDLFQLPGGRVGLLVADVSGKGTSAALYMAELKGLVLSLSQIYDSPRQLLIEVNRIISENLDSRSFITMTYAVIDRARGRMTYARAGHTPLMYLPRAAARAEVLTPSGMVVGLRIDGAAEKFAELLEEHAITLEPGDVLALYTDGITEAMDGENELFGDTRLAALLEEHGHLEAGELRERVLREVEAFVGSADQHDDMTLILLKVEELMADSRSPAVAAAAEPLVAAGSPGGPHGRAATERPA